MSEYVSKLILSYFQSIESKYDLHELVQLTGKNYKELTSIISELIDKGYISYNEYELRITGKGKAHLLSNDNILLKNIDPSSALSIETPYVPKHFKLYK